MTHATAVLLTGATGMLGQEVLVQLVTQTAAPIIIIARRSKGQNPHRRIQAVLRRHVCGAALAEACARVEVLEGDVTLPYFGLDTATFAATAARLARIIHCAAAVRFDQPIAEARQINVEGTRQVLALARQAAQHNPAFRLDYVGTAYIVGNTHGVVYEREIGRARRFHNTYEQSKLEAELLVREAMDDIATTIYRPSIIIGNAQTGETGNFKAFYWPIRAYALGQLPILPGVAGCKIDLVPVDYVARALLFIGARPDSIGGCYHLTAGRDNLVTLQQVFDAAVAFFGVRPPRLIHPRWLRLLDTPPGRVLFPASAHKTLKLGLPYFPYLALNIQFDTTNTQTALAGSAIAPVTISHYFDRLFRYCVATDWGHRPATDIATPVLTAVGAEE